MTITAEQLQSLTNSQIEEIETSLDEHIEQLIEEQNAAVDADPAGDYEHLDDEIIRLNDLLTFVRKFYK